MWDPALQLVVITYPPGAFGLVKVAKYKCEPHKGCENVSFMIHPSIKGLSEVTIGVINEALVFYHPMKPRVNGQAWIENHTRFSSSIFFMKLFIGIFLSRKSNLNYKFS
jgi:hypothetical protein